MSFNPALDHYCNAWPADDSIVTTDLKTRPYNQSFTIKIHAEFTNPTAHNTSHALTSMTRVMEFSVPCDRLIETKSSWSVISSMLSLVGVPLDSQPFMMHRISVCAREMASAAHNVGLKVLPMNVSLGAVVDLRYDRVNTDTTAIRESMAGVVFRPVPVSFVEALEKVKVRDSGSINQCMVCLEGLEVGSEATLMPCSHIYHGGCIVNWLKVSNLCPLCRFQMPT